MKIQKAIEMRDSVLTEMKRRDVSWGRTLKQLGEQFEKQSLTRQRPMMIQGPPAILTQDDELAGGVSLETEGAPTQQDYSLKGRYDDIGDIWDEWVGAVGFPEGGIRAMEAKGKKWRQHFTSAEKQQFSRYRQVVKGIEAMALQQGGVSGSIVHLRSIYMVECKSTLTKMSNWVKSTGLIKAKTRGGLSQETQDDDDNN